ncbi:MAG: DUF1800 domain-containing protein [Chthonomonas sp.]|nr:DUF1800 domain-containing protein [Chthonomonas sp.]
MKAEHALALGAAGVLAGCGPLANRLHPPLAAGLDFTPAPEAARFLARAGFGAAPGDEAAFVGAPEWVSQQLKGDLEEPGHLSARLARLDVMRIEGWELGDVPEDRLIRQLQQAAILRALYSPNQLRERMVEFWSDHFNIHAKKASGVYLMTTDQASVIRQHWNGNFGNLLMASAKSPAMLNYLDNRVNNSRGVNENYAREILELHSLGVHGGYTQRDVRELARALSGWTIEDRAFRPRARFRFREEWHDAGAKKFLGRTFDQPGPRDAEAMIEMVALHPATAEFLATKLCRFFTGQTPPALVERLAAKFLAEKGEIKPMLSELLTDPIMLAETGPARRPFDYIVACLRQVNAAVDGPAIAEQVRGMGQPLYEWPMPDGFPVDTDAWAGSLLARWNFAVALGEDRVPGVVVRWDELTERIGQPKSAWIERMLAPAMHWKGAGHV